MNIIEAEKIARNLMEQHGLTAGGWVFKFDGAKSRLGQCNYTRKTITISRHMAGTGTVENVTQTMLHEIAHALTPLYEKRYSRTKGYHMAKVGHGQSWKSKAHQIGYTGKRLAENPYTTAQQSQLPVSASFTPATSTTSLLPERTPVRLSNGVEGTITKINRVNYLVLAGDGQTWTVPFRLATKIGEAPASLISTVAVNTVRFDRGQRVKTVLPVGRNSKYAGLTGVVKNAGSKNYILTLDDGRLLTVPHSMAVLTD